MADAWDALPDAPAVAAPPAPAHDEWDKVPDAPGATSPSSPGFIAAVRDHVEPVLNAFGQGFREGWGPERWGMSEANTKWLSKVGIYAPEGATKYENPFHAFNELLMETTARSLELTSRGVPAIYRGLQGAGVAAGLPGDIVSIPDAFMGSPHPTGMPSRASAAGARAGAFGEAVKKTFAEGEGEHGTISIQPTPPEAGVGEIQKQIAPGVYTEGDKAFVEGAPRADFIRNIADGNTDVPTVDSLREALNATQEADRRYSNAVGISDADYKRMRHLNRVADEGGIAADEAIAELRTIREKATADHELDIPDEDSLKQLITEFGSLERQGGETLAQYEDGIARVLKRYVADYIDRDEFARAVFRKAFVEAEAHGFDTKKLGNDVISRFMGDLSQSDQAFMREEFSKFTQKNLPPSEIRASELANGERAPDLQDMTDARQLGVIGPEKPPLADVPPREAAARATVPPDDILKGPEPEGAPQPTGNAWADRFEHFVNKLETGDDVKDLIRDAAHDNEGFTEARAGEVPLGHVESLAEAAGVTPDTVNPRGIGRVMKNDAEVRVGMQMMLQATENVRDAARDVRSDPSPENMIKLQEAMMRRDLAVEQIVGLRAEWGRTGGVFQEFMRNVKDEESFNEFLKKRGRTPDDLKDIADALDKMDGTQAARALSEMHSKAPGFFHWNWVQGLISGFLTHTKYVMANALYTASEHGIVPPIAAVIGKAKQLFGADVDRVYFGEPLAATWGMIGAVPEAMFATGKSIWSGQRAVLKSEIELHREMVARGEKVPPIIDRAVNQISGQGKPAIFGDASNVWGRLSAGDIGGAAKDALGRVLGAPGDMAMGIHTFFKVLGERAALGAEAYREALKDGLNPAEADFWRRRSEHLENPTTDMQERAIASAYKGTFMNELGPHGRAWQRFTKDTPGLKWIFPFSHIPVNLIKATYEGTPLALLDADMRADITGKNGGVRQDKAIARMVAGSAIMGYFVNSALNGRATGDLPLDPKERDAWKLQGKQPNSILVGGYWVSFNKFGPAGDLANLGANIGYVIPLLQSHDDDAMTKATWHSANAAARLVVDEVGFQSLANLFEAVHDEKKGTKWAASTAASFLPFSSALGQGASYMDPHMREAKTFIDGIKYKIPGQRETLLPKRDWLGQPIANPQYGNIIRQRAAITDPTSHQMDVLQIHPAPPQDRIGGVKLTPALYDEYQVLAGAMAKTALDNLVRMPGFTDMPTSARIESIHSQINMSHKFAQSIMQVKHPELLGQGMQQRIDYITGKSLTKNPKKAPVEPAASETTTPATDIERQTLGSFINRIWGGDTSKTYSAEKGGNYPSKEDAASARAGGFAYGTEWESFFNNELAKVMGTEKTVREDRQTKAIFIPASAVGMSLDQAIGAGDDAKRSKLINLNAPENAEIKASISDTFARAALAANRDAIATLGFSPSKTLTDVKIGKSNIGGAYSKTRDAMYVNLADETGSSIVHESIHRGLEVLRRNSAQAREILGNMPNEEYVVRHIMSAAMGNIEQGQGAAGDVEIGKARYHFEQSLQSGAYQKGLDQLRVLASEQIAKRRERGPR